MCADFRIVFIPNFGVRLSKNPRENKSGKKEPNIIRNITEKNMVNIIIILIILYSVIALFIFMLRAKFNARFYQPKHCSQYAPRMRSYQAPMFYFRDEPLPGKDRFFYFSPETPEMPIPEPDYKILDDYEPAENQENMVSGMPSILEQIKHEWNQRIRLVGTQNSGKTTLALWIVQVYKDMGAHVIVLDSHNQKAGPANNWTGKWPVSEIYGTCNNYSELEDKAGGLITLIEQRLNDVGMGNVKERGAEPLILLVAEELYDMMANCKENMKTLKRKVMSVARKGNIDYLEISQTDRAVAAGMKGSADMNNFDLDIKLTVENGERTCEANKEFYALPGKYVNTQKQKQRDNERVMLNTLDTPLKEECNTQNIHDQIRDLHAQGMSYSQIAIKAGFGKGGNQSEKVKAILGDTESLKNMHYPEYLKTEHWQKTRKQKLTEAGYKCQLCGIENVQLDIHHNNYKNRGNEQMTDLICLCHTCHFKFHGKKEPK